MLTNSIKLWPRETKKIISICSIGCLLEFYDFFIFALVADIIARQYFPSHEITLSLMATLATYGTGYLARPLGGIVLAHIGDRYERSKPFSNAILIMAASTLLIGCIPTYASIGIAAPIAILILRILQGISLGGELPGAVTYLFELVPKQRLSACTFISLGVGMGVLVALLVYNILLITLDTESFESWGWRILFLLGGLIGWIGYFQRRSFYESPAYIKIQHNVAKVPFIEVFRKSKRVLLSGFIITGTFATTVALFVVLAPVYLTQTLTFSRKDVSTSLIYAELIGLVTTLLVGKFISYNHLTKLAITSLILSLLFSVPIFYFYSELGWLYMPMALGVVLGAVLMAFIPALLAGSFPTSHRYTGLAIAYNASLALFGGIIPLIALALIDVTSSPLVPGFLITAMAAISLCTIKPLVSSKNVNKGKLQSAL